MSVALTKRGAFYSDGTGTVPAGGDLVVTFESAEVPPIYGFDQLDANGSGVFVSVLPTTTQMTLHNPGGVDALVHAYVWDMPYSER